MSNISNESLEEMAAEGIGSDVEFAVSVMARELLEYRKASKEPIVWMNRFTGRAFELEQQPGADKDPDIYIPLYAAPPAPVLPDGYALVPMEPTEKMLNAWLSEVANWRGHVTGYKAMLSAAPQPGDVSKK